MKYFIYTRKSTESAERQVMSLESQLSELKEFAAKEKLEIVLSAPVQGEAGGRGGWGGFRPPSPVSSVRIFSNRHRQKCECRRKFFARSSKNLIVHRRKEER